MATWLKQSTAVEVAIGPFLDETDGKTAETALTITQADIRLKKNGGAWAQKNAAQTLSHEENGWYEISLDTTDTNTLGILIVAIHESGALPCWREFMVVPANIYDSVVSGSDLIDVSTTQFNGSAVTASSGRPEVNMTHIAGSAVSTSSAQLGVNVVNAGGTAWASGSLTSGVFAADAITAAKLHADVTTELQSGLATAAALDTVDNFLDTEVAAILAAVDTEVAAIKAVTDLLPDAGALSSLATAAALDTVDNFLDTEIAAIKAKTDQLTFTTANQVDATTVTNSDKTGYTASTVSDKTGYRLSATGVGDILTTALTEAYAADGAAFTLTQALYEICQSITEFAIASTTISVKKRDGVTEALTYTLDDATNPTSRTRAT